MQPSDEAIISRVRTGDVDAFGALVRRNERAVYAYAYGLLRNAHEAEEAAEEAFVRAFTSLARLDDPAKFHAWVRGITRHVCQHWQAKRKRRPLSLDSEPDGQKPRLAFGGGAQAPSPVVSAETAEFEASIAEIIASLPEKYAAVARLRFEAQAKVSAIAAELSLSVEAVESRLRRAKAMLRDKLVRRYPHLRDRYGL